jgi:hypothetical protein
MFQLPEHRNLWYDIHLGDLLSRHMRTILRPPRIWAWTASLLSAAHCVERWEPSRVCRGLRAARQRASTFCIQCWILWFSNQTDGTKNPKLFWPRFVEGASTVIDSLKCSSKRHHWSERWFLIWLVQLTIARSYIRRWQEYGCGGGRDREGKVNREKKTVMGPPKSQLPWFRIFRKYFVGNFLRFVFRVLIILEWLEML